MRLVDNIFYSMLGAKSTPAEAYIYYDYIEAHGQTSQYIDTGVIVGGDCSIEIDYIWMSRGGGNISIWLCGAQDSGSLSYRLRCANGIFIPRYFNHESDLQSPVIAFQKTYAYQRHKNVITVYDGDSVFYTVTTTLKAKSSAHTHYLFATNNAGTPSSSYGLTDTRLGHVRLYDSNGILIRDFRPAVRIADGVAGMHDVVNDVFYTNANPAGDNFLYGNLT